MFPLGIAARKGPQGREASLRHTKSRSRRTWRIPREFLLRMVSAEQVSRVLQEMLRGRLSRWMD